MSSHARYIRKLIFVSTQDASQISSWSNVPYMFCQALKSQGVELEQITLRENPLLRWLVLVTLKLGKVLFGWNTTWDYSRSWLHFVDARRQVDRACRVHVHDAVLVVGFSFGPSMPSEKPLFLFGDWSYDYAIEQQRGRSADFLERGSIAREKKLMAQADAALVLFPLAKQYVMRTNPKANSHYLGNVINAIEEPRIADLEAKCASFSLLFVGKPHYLQGAERLIEAYKLLKQRFPLLTLDIIGMDQSFFASLPDGVTCHGYLNKGQERDRETYYGLLRKARLFVNTNPKWASFSATVEALYFYTPIITSRYAEIEETFGESLLFGFYFDETQKSLEDVIASLLNDPDYCEKAIQAHAATRDFSWHNYVTRVLEIANEKLGLRKN